MSKHLITKESTPHGAISWHHNGKDGQYCEAGETVKIKWQPTAGWGLQEAHYTTATDPDTAVAIDLTQREFTMPADDITISGTFKKFTIGDWTSGTDAASNAGKVLGFDEGGNLVPVEGGGGSGGGGGAFDGWPRYLSFETTSTEIGSELSVNFPTDVPIDFDSAAVGYIDKGIFNQLSVIDDAATAGNKTFNLWGEFQSNQILVIAFLDGTKVETYQEGIVKLVSP